MVEANDLGYVAIVSFFAFKLRLATCKLRVLRLKSLEIALQPIPMPIPLFPPLLALVYSL